MIRWLANLSFHVIFILIFAISWLNLVRPWTMDLWKVSILTREYGLPLFALMIICGVLSFLRSRHGKLSYIVAQFGMLVASGYLLLTPITSAWTQSESLSKHLNEQFSNPKGSLKIEVGFWTALNVLPPRSISPTSLTYRSGPGEQMNLDYYSNPLGSSSPLIVIFHGGGWQSGDLKQLSQVPHKLIELGYNVASVSYRFTPEHKWPAQLQDGSDALDYLVQNASQLQFNPKNIYLMGRSAGGQVAGMTAYLNKKHSIRGVILLYAPTDMGWGYEISEPIDMLGSRKLIEDLIGGKFLDSEAAYNQASPIFNLESAVPTLLIHGKPDPLTFHKHSERLHNRLLRANRASAFVQLDWATHGFEFNTNGPASQIFYQALDHFVHSTVLTESL